MEELMQKLQSVLNDEQSMKQLSELAGALSGDAKNSSANPDISELLGSLGQADSFQNTERKPAADGLDVARLLQLQAIMQQANKHDKNVDLLLALKPLLKEENHVKIDRVIKIFKLFAIYPALKESGLLGGDLFGLL